MSDSPAADRSASIVRQTLLLAQAHDAIILTDVDGTITEWNRGAEQALGYSAEEMIGKPIAGLYPPAEWPALEAKVIADLSSTGEHDCVLRARHKSGREVMLDARLVLLRGAGGEPVGIASYSLDITARGAAEQALAESERRFRTLAEVSPTGIYRADLVNGCTYANASIAAMFDLPADEILGHGWTTCVHPEDRDQVARAWKHTVATRADFVAEYRLLRQNGEIVWVANHGRCESGGGDNLSYVGTTVDVTAHKRAEVLLRESANRLRGILDGMYAFVGMFSLDGVLIDVNRAPLDATGVSREDVIGKPIAEATWWSYDPAVQAQLRDAIRRAAYGEAVRGDFVARCGDGVYRTFDGMFGPLYDSEGRIVRVIASGTDVTDRKQIEDDLRRNQVRLRLGLEALGATTFDQDADLRYTWIQQPVLGFTVEDVIGKTDEEVLGVEGARAIMPLKRRALERGEGVSAEVPVAFGGELRYFQMIVEPLLDDDGRARGLVGVSLDITERQRTLELQSRLEAQLAQARKLEAIGTLAGGVAHDFNNILGAILGNTQLALRALATDHPVVARLVEIDRATQRGAELVRQILAFGHQGSGQRSLIELSTVVAEAVDLIRASLPTTVELVVSSGSDAPAVFANATQVHQVVMNLCANALYAIGAGPGRIEVRLDGVVLDESAPHIHADLSPGLYARLTVTDTGPGMDAATLERIFEPFFTTKPFGEGTGLGLSVVHGIVGAHGGAVAASSTPGRGATVVYLPAVGAPAAEQGKPGDAGDVPLSEGARVLFLDDEQSLVWLGITQLELLGYRVTGFTVAAEALVTLRADPQGFDLVVTDFTMPGVSGLDVASEIRQIRPDLPVAVTSGRVTPELRAGAEAAGVRSVLPKPYSVGELARVLRQLTVTARPAP